MATIHFSQKDKSHSIQNSEDAAKVLAPRENSTDLIGVEAEAFLVSSDRGTPADTHAFVSILSRYKETAGFGTFLTETKADGQKIVIGLTDGKGLHAGADITVEPGFQPEYGGEAQSDLHKVAKRLDSHLDHLAAAAYVHGYRVTMPGLHPLYAGDQLPIIGKKRYALMTEQARQKSGADGLSAMRGTTGVQYNLDTSEENWALRYRVAFALQPFTSALSTNSPYKGGKNTGDASHRSVLWFKNWGGDWARDIADTVFASDFSRVKLTSYIANNLSLPFLVRPGDKGALNYVDVGGKTFAQLLKNRPDALGDLTETDVVAMVGFSFLPVKPKKHGVIELRGADGSYALRLAQGALPVGILYDDVALKAADKLFQSMTGEEYVAITNNVIRSGIDAAMPGGGRVRDVVRELLGLSEAGLKRRGLGEEVYLKPFQDIANGHKATPGQQLIHRARMIERQNKLSHREAIVQAFLETAVPVRRGQKLNLAKKSRLSLNSSGLNL